MKLELAFSVLSKTNTLLGINLETHYGIIRDDNLLQRERIIELRIGLVFMILSISFITKGEVIDMPDNIMETMNRMENHLKEYKPKNDE